MCPALQKYCDVISPRYTNLVFDVSLMVNPPECASSLTEIIFLWLKLLLLFSISFQNVLQISKMEKMEKAHYYF